ncbi:class I SAM-dependent methyltransferase [bacterium]|nr:class I SAM-dependent methyltransferase [candidate division CSSED10-310 bacterium]
MPEDTYFSTRLSYEPKRDAVWAEITRYLQRFIPADAVILELGAGYCSFINQVHAREKHALDRSSILTDYADPSVIRHVRDCENLRHFKDAQFDTVFSSFLYEHLTRDKLNRVMDHLRRILKPGGILITMLPNYKYVCRHYFDDYTHVQVFTHISFSDYLVSRGFVIEHVEGRFLPYSFKSWLPPSPLLTRIYLSLPFRPLAGNMLVVAKNTPSQRTHEEFRREIVAERKPGRITEKPEPTVLQPGPVEETSASRTEIRHGRRSRRSAADHYGVKTGQKESSRRELSREMAPDTTTADNLRIGRSHSSAMKDDRKPISPQELRNRRRKK